MQHVLRRLSGLETAEKVTPEMIEMTAGLDIDVVGDGYMEMLEYRLGEKPVFVDKLPFNVFYMGYIAKAFPDAKLILVDRNPLESCFAMYKQVCTWAFKFSYDLKTLTRFYIVYDRLVSHWCTVLADRLITVRSEKLISDQENQTRSLLDKLGLPFEEACINFEQNESPTATASSVQVGQKIHTESVNRGKNYENELQALCDDLEAAGIEVA